MNRHLTIASITRDIVGADRGFNVAADVPSITADGVSLNDLWREFSTALAEWNKTRDAISALSTRATTESFAQTLVGSNNIEFEKQSELGVPQASRVSPDYIRMGFPLNWSDAGLRYTRKFLRDATAEQVCAQHLAALEADNRATFRDTMSALTTKAQKGSRGANQNGVEILRPLGRIDRRGSAFVRRPIVHVHPRSLPRVGCDADRIRRHRGADHHDSGARPRSARVERAAHHHGEPRTDGRDQLVEERRSQRERRGREVRLHPCHVGTGIPDGSDYRRRPLTVPVQRSRARRVNTATRG